MAIKLLLLLLVLRAAGRSQANSPALLMSSSSPPLPNTSPRVSGLCLELRGGGDNLYEKSEREARTKLSMNQLKEEHWKEMLQECNSDEIEDDDLLNMYQQVENDEEEDENDLATTPSDEMFREVVQHSIDEDIPRLRSSLRNYREHLPHVLTKLRPITPLMFAAKSGKSVSVRVLLDHGSNASQTGPGDMNAFHIAASSGFTPICRILFNFDPNLLETCDAFGGRAVHYAADDGQLDVLKWLHSVNASLSSEGPNRATPLHLARDRNWTNVCDFLMEALCLDSLPPASLRDIPKSRNIYDQFAYRYDDLSDSDNDSDQSSQFDVISDMGLRSASNPPFDLSFNGSDPYQPLSDRHGQIQAGSRKRNYSMAREKINDRDEDQELSSKASKDSSSCKEKSSDMPFQEVGEQRVKEMFSRELEEAKKKAFEDMNSEECEKLFNFK